MAWTNTLDTNVPDGATQKVPVLDNAIKTNAKAWQERLNVCLYMPLTGTQVSDTDAGKIRKILFQAAGTKSTLSAGEFEIFPKTISGKTEIVLQSEDGDEIVLTSVGYLLGSSIKADSIGSAPIQIENNTNLKAANAAGDGEIDLIKANASDKVEIPDEAQLASSAAPTTDAQIANKKYVDDAIDTDVEAAKLRYGSHAGSDSTTYTVVLPFTPIWVMAGNESDNGDNYWIYGMGSNNSKDSSSGDMKTGNLQVDVPNKTITFPPNVVEINNAGKTFWYIAIGGVELNPS